MNSLGFTPGNPHVGRLLSIIIKISNGLAHGNAARNIHVHGQFTVGAELGGEGQGQGERVIDHAAFDALELIVEFHVKAGCILHELCNRGIHLPHPFDIGPGQYALVGDIQRDERDRHPGVVDDVGGMRVHVGIELGQGSGVALIADRAAHDDHFPDRLDDARLLPDRQGDVRERADRHQGDLPRGGRSSRSGNRFHAGPQAGARDRKLCVPEAGIPVRLGREQGWLDERQFTSSGNRNVTGVGQLEDRQGVDGRLLERAVSVHDAQAFEGKLRRSKRQQNGAGVIDAGIGVKDDLFGHVSQGSCGSVIPFFAGTAR